MSSAGPAAGTAGAGRNRRSLRPVTLVQAGGPILLAVIAFATPGFLSTASLTTLVSSMSFVGCVATGMTLITISGNVMAFSLASTLMAAGMAFSAVYNVAGLGPAIPAALAAGAALGAIQGFVIGWFRANPIIVSIAALALIHGMVQNLTGGNSIYLVAGGSAQLLKTKIAGIPIEFPLFLLTVLVAALILRRTVFGRNIFMVGDGAATAEAIGIRVWRTITGTYLWAGLFSAVPGILLAARFDHGNSNNGQGFDYGAIAAILVGGTSIVGGTGSVWRTLGGVAFMAVVQAILLLRGASTQVQFFSVGVVVMAVILLQAAGSAAGGAAATNAVRSSAAHPHRRPLLLLAFAFVIMILLDAGQGRFLTTATAFSALQNFATLGPVALGLGLTMLIREFDLSVAGVFGLAGCVAVLTAGGHPALGMACALLAGAFTGLLQGVIITRLRIGSIGVTLGGMLLATGIAYMLTEGKSIPYDDIDTALAVNSKFTELLKDAFPGFAASGFAVLTDILSVRSIVAILLFLAAAFVVGTTRIGRDMIAMGSDRRAAMIAGVSVERLLIGTFVAAGVLAALSGSLLSFGLASGAPSGLSDILVPATAAAILGGVSLSGGAGRPLGIACGALTLAVLRAGLSGLGASAAVHDIVTGLVLLGVSIFDGAAFVRRTLFFRRLWKRAGPDR